LADAAPERRPVPLLLFGDSITYGWHVDGNATWERDFAPSGALALGHGGNRTGDLLRRIRAGELDRYAPATIVLLIGTNDLGAGASAAKTAAGVEADVRALRARVPAAHIVVLGILPRGQGRADTPVRRKVAAVNARLATLDTIPGVRFVDLGRAFLTPGGEVRPDYFRPDLLHLSTLGYEAFSVALRAALAKLGQEVR
jgi:platelet-activating factor acetylhydrolase IB subunit beta/gamma